MVSRGKSKKRRAANMEAALQSKAKLGLTSAATKLTSARRAGVRLGSESLPPPPSSKDSNALPSSLRRMMMLKEAAMQGARKKQRRDETHHDSNKKTEKVQASDGRQEGEGSTGAKVSRGADGGDLNEASKLVVPARRRKQKLDSYKARKKQKQSDKKWQATRDKMQQVDTVSFGEVVMAPPKSLPKLKGQDKAKVQSKLLLTSLSKVGHEESGTKMKRQGMTVSQERMRQAAIEEYRHKRGWHHRPTKDLQLPSISQENSFLLE